jgi:hypothetical protein
MSVPTVVINLGSAAIDMEPDQYTSGINDVLFTRLGVLTPSVQTMSKPNARGVSTVTFDGTELGAVDPSRAAESIADLLATRAPELVTPCLVEFYMSRLLPRLPALAAAVRRQFSTADIVDALRRQLARGESIRDFARALEQMLLSAASGAEERAQSPNARARASV